MKGDVLIVIFQLRAARSLLGWSQSKLAEASGLAISTIKRMEGSSGTLRGTAKNVWNLQRTLEDAGVIFIDPEKGVGGPGVRLKEDL